MIIDHLRRGRACPCLYSFYKGSVSRRRLPPDHLRQVFHRAHPHSFLKELAGQSANHI